MPSRSKARKRPVREYWLTESQITALRTGLHCPAAVLPTRTLSLACCPVVRSQYRRLSASALISSGSG
eukprot:8012504-Lingulodinium_polyedra.AAC.1